MRRGAGALVLACVACSLPATKGPAVAEHVPFSKKEGPVALPGAEIHGGIAYASSSPSETLDIFVPHHAKKPTPVVVRIHGGGFDNGSARTAAQGLAARAIVNAGYALVAVSYRPSTEASFPAAARDVKAAIRFLRANAARWGLDPERIAAWGESSGGWLAAMLGVTGDQPSLFDDPYLGNPHTSSAVQAVVDWYGPTDFATMDAQHERHPPVACRETYARHGGPATPESTWLCGDRSASLTDASCARAVRAANLVAYVATASVLPPFAIAHGADDCEVPWWQSVELAEALRKREAVVTYSKVPRAVHADPAIEAAETPRALELLAQAFKPAAPTE